MSDVNSRVRSHLEVGEQGYAYHSCPAAEQLGDLGPACPMSL